MSYRSPAIEMENSKAELEDQGTARVHRKFEFCLWVLGLSHWASITFFNDFSLFFFCLAIAYCFQRFHIASIVKFWILQNIFTALIFSVSLPRQHFWLGRNYFKFIQRKMTYEHKIHKILSIRMKAEQYWSFLCWNMICLQTDEKLSTTNILLKFWS